MKGRDLVKLLVPFVVFVLLVTTCGPAPTVAPTAAPTQAAPTAAVTAGPAPLSGEITAIAPVDTPGFFPSQARKFEELHPGVKVNFIESGYELLETKLTSDLAAGTYAYDVMFSFARHIPTFSDAGWIQPIDLAAYGLDKGNTALFLTQYKGQYWGVPYTAWPQVFSYNEEILAKVGKEPPKTWDDVTAILKAVKEQGIMEYPWAVALKEGQYGPRVIQQQCMAFGGRIADDDGTPRIDSPECKLGLEYLVMLYREGLLDPASLVADDFEMDNAFAQGRYALARGSTWGFTQAVKNPTMSSVMGKVHLVPTPQHDGKGAAWVAGLVMMVPKTAKNVPLAIEFMKYMVSYAGGTDNLLTTGNLTTVEAVATDPQALAQVEGLEIMMNEVKNGIPEPKVVWLNDWYTWVSPLIAPLVKGDLSVDDFVAQNVEWMKQQK
jgi:multiple sugar transport system substrate-binding protein